MDRKRVAGLGALDVERARLGVHEAEVDHARDDVLRAADPAPEGVLGPDLQHGAGPHAGHRLDPAEGPGELRRVGAMAVPAPALSVTRPPPGTRPARWAPPGRLCPSHGRGPGDAGTGRPGR